MHAHSYQLIQRIVLPTNGHQRYLSLGSLPSIAADPNGFSVRPFVPLFAQHLLQFALSLPFSPSPLIFNQQRDIAGEWQRWQRFQADSVSQEVSRPRRYYYLL